MLICRHNLSPSSAFYSRFPWRYSVLKKKVGSFTFFWIGILRLNHGHCRHERVTHLPCFGGRGIKWVGSPPLKMAGSLRKGHFWGKKLKVKGLYGIFFSRDIAIIFVYFLMARK
jgi:hypothetical protein